MLTALPGHEDVLFLSIQKKLISVDAVEKLVSKHVQDGLGKYITPHKLRSTYGTMLYQETGDIYLVVDALGHSDISTTKSRYSAMEDSHCRIARDKIRIRE